MGFFSRHGGPLANAKAINYAIDDALVRRTILGRAIPERVTWKPDDGGRHHVAFASFGFGFTRF